MRFFLSYLWIHLTSPFTCNNNEKDALVFNCLYVSDLIHHCLHVNVLFFCHCRRSSVDLARKDSHKCMVLRAKVKSMGAPWPVHCNGYGLEEEWTDLLLVNNWFQLMSKTRVHFLWSLNEIARKRWGPLD